jgi:CRISPR-associated endonuclease/helicase Cas3
VDIRLKPLRLALSGVRWRGIELLTHQAAALSRLQSPRLVVEAPTGGGKTWTAAVPLIDGLDRGEGAIFTYPTNALAEDQQESLLTLLRKAGRPAATVEANGTLRGENNAEVLLWRLDSNVLDEAQDATRARRRGEAMSRLLQRIPARPLWLITNPDTLFLLAIGRYWNSPQVWSRLAACNTLVMDEFHLYTGPTLVRALLLIELAKHVMTVPRVRLLSATLPAGLRALLKERLGFEAIEAEETGDEIGRTVQYPLTLEIVPVAGSEQAGGFAARFVSDRLPTLREEVSQEGVPLVILRQSVLAAASLEDELVRCGLARDEIGIYRGLTSRRIRSMAGKTLVIGTSALEVGVDFRTKRLVFEALSSTSFVQRLGRVGRHQPGEAHFITDGRVAQALASIPAEIGRRELFARMSDILAADDDLESFVTSRWGGVVAFAALGALAGEVARLGGSPEFEARLQAVERTMVEVLGTTSEAAKLAVDNPKVWKRLAGAVGFRGGAGSVEVFDVRERDRRESSDLARYEVDLPTFFARARLALGTETRATPVVVGYGKKLPLHLDTTLLSARTTPSLNAPMAEQIELRVDGQVHAYEELLRDELPVVGFFARQLLSRLSWREDVFESSDGRIALLNDDALKAIFLLERP